MGSDDDPRRGWREEAIKRANERIQWERERDGRRSRKPKAWLDALRARLVVFWKMDILGSREHTRLDLLPSTELPPSDRKRLQNEGLLGRGLYVVGIQPDPRRDQINLIDRALMLKDGERLVSGNLRVLCFIGPSGHAIGTSIQIQGILASRERPVYARYDLDAVPLGDDQLTHFDAHWHYGEDPNGADDPRWPAMVLDPDEALDVLLEMWFPAKKGRAA